MTILVSFLVAIVFYKIGFTDGEDSGWMACEKHWKVLVRK